MKIFIKVKPGAKQEGVERRDATHFVVRVRARATAGEANRAVERVLAEYFKTPVTKVRIIRGRSSREKVIEVG
ncbi:MAG: DUF167 domain-containing protein [Candidatus Sungbacteria bacterium]|uniref:DUF167 domain-containing protein n=1 Tax=Candidatus Sungiibacteriota bacterium TaxID=2750080 RepID=A0A932YXA4_9BACT|nr:DUF167 domain-containing protein [Candidatus Sungbacteria bacterium]